MTPLCAVSQHSVRFPPPWAFACCLLGAPGIMMVSKNKSLQSHFPITVLGTLLPLQSQG